MTLKNLFLILFVSPSLRCPHCRGTFMPRNYFTFKDKCTQCDFVFQGESGDFWGGMVFSYAFGGVTALVVAALILVFDWPPLSPEGIAYTVAFIALGAVVLSFPFAKSAWIYLLYHTRGQYEEYRPGSAGKAPGA